MVLLNYFVGGYVNPPKKNQPWKNQPFKCITSKNNCIATNQEEQERKLPMKKECLLLKDMFDILGWPIMALNQSSNILLSTMTLSTWIMTWR